MEFVGSGVDADPVVGEFEGRQRGDSGHVAIDAVGSGFGGFVFRLGVAGGALIVVKGYGFDEWGVGIVAGEATEISVFEAGALAEVDGLVADIPGVIPIDGGRV